MRAKARSLGLAALVTVLGLATSTEPAAAASGKLIDTVTVDAGKLTVTSGSVPLKAGGHYTLVVSGTLSSQDATGVSTIVFHDDALYCYEAQGNGQNQCSPQFPSEDLFVGVGNMSFGGSSSNGPDIDEFQSPNGPHFDENEIPYRSDHTYTTDFYPPVDGVLKAGGYNAVYGCGARHTQCSNRTSGTFTIQIFEAEPAVELSFASRHVEVQLGGAPWQAAAKGMQLHVGDRVHTGWKSSAELKLPGGSTLLVGPMSLLRIDKLEVNPDGSLKANVFLNLGEVKAQIQKLPGSRGDFNVRTPTTTASVRGTKFSVYYDGVSTIVSVTEHKVAVTPAAGKTVVVPAGREVSSTARRVGPLSPLGRAGAPSGSVGPAAALTLLASRIAKGVAACHADVYATSLATRPRGWRASLTVAGHRHGSAIWTITGTKLKPANALARLIAAGCRGSSLALSWTGTWRTSFGVMHLKQSGNRVTGRYALCNAAATISGVVLGGTSLYGGWSQLCNNRSGQIAFAFSPDGNSFSGRWSYGAAAPASPWNGTRT